MNDRTFDDEIADIPMPTPKECIENLEVYLGVPKEIARKIAGLDDFRPRMGKEIEGQRRSRVTTQALRRIENRIRRLGEVETHPFNEGGSYPAWARDANLRKEVQVMVLYWVRGLLENGGCEPIDWAPDLEPCPEATSIPS